MGIRYCGAIFSEVVYPTFYVLMCKQLVEVSSFTEQKSHKSSLKYIPGYTRE